MDGLLPGARHGLAATPLLALSRALAPSLSAVPGALALAGWICLSLGEKDEANCLTARI